ncbi:MAG: DUF4899 domain-containing protein [Spirochaetes bacterium]|nr:DUF4899 domain-containing protein [Spirochaetota bacterium]
MDELIQKLVMDTGADKQTAEMILKFTGGDLEGAKKIFDSMPKDYLVLKMRYMGHKTHHYGVILIIMNIKNSEIEEMEVTVGKDMKASEIDTNLPYETFKDQLREYIRTGNVNLILIDRLKEGILTPEFKVGLFKDVSSEGVINLNNLKIQFSELFFKVFTEPNAAIKATQERIDVFRYAKKKGTAAQEEEEKKEPEKTKEEEIKKREELEIRSISLVLLKIEPILSPVKGVPVGDLQVGDEIMVRIIDERDIGDYLAKLLNGKEGENRIPISATVKEIERSADTENVMILVQFGPGIAGRCFVPPEIKIQTPISEELAELKKLSGFTLNPIFIIFILIILFVIFVIITIFSTGE